MAEPTNSLRYLNRACRACLDTNFTESVSLQQDDWLELYKYCANAEIPDEQLPQLVLCGKCAVTVKLCAEFKRKCAQSEAFWHSLLRKNVECKTASLDCPLTSKVLWDNKTSTLDNRVQNSNRLNIETEVKQELEDGDQSIDIEETVFDDNFELNHEFDIPEVKNDQENTVTYIKTLNGVTLKLIPKTEQKKELKAKNKVLNRQSGSRISVKKGIATQSGLKRKRKSQMKKYICDTCGISFKLRSMIVMHIQNNCDVKCCGLCEFKADDVTEVTNHVVQEHYNNNELKCRLCDYEGLDFACMISHRVKHATNASKKVACILCGRVKFRATSAEFHFREAHLGAPGGLCHICRKRLKCERKWKKHVFFHRDGFRCQVKRCGKRYQTKEALDNHLKNHPKPKTFICDACGFICHKGSNLVSHVRNMHTPSTISTCEVCGRRCKASHMRKHMRVHQERPLKCPSCPKSYYCPAELRAHRLQHTVPDAKPHKCDVCGLRYRWKSALTCHRVKHTGIPVRSCSECGEKFLTYTAWKRHLARHTGVKQYPCTLCDKSYHAKGGLKQHVAKCHVHE